MAKRLFFQVGEQYDVVGHYFEKVHKKYKGQKFVEVQQFKNSETTLSLLRVNNRVQAFVIETRTDFNDIEYICDTIKDK